MKLNKKQISLGALAAVTMIAVPIATVISCGSTKEDTKQGSTTPAGAVETANHKIIDLEKMASTPELFTRLNDILNNAMPKIATDLPKTVESNGKYSMTPEGFKNVEGYMNAINSKIQKITFKFKGEEFTWDLSKLQKTIASVKAKISKGIANQIPSGVLEFMGQESPTLAIYPAKMDKGGDTGAILLGMKLIGFTTLPEHGFEDYKQMLTSYHELSLEFIKTNIYKEWIKDKKFELPSSDTTKPNTRTIVKYESGKGFDDHSSALMTVPGGMVSSKFATEANNFEAQWVLSIMNF